MLIRHPSPKTAVTSTPDPSATDAIRGFVTDRLAVPPWILLVQLFIGVGWLRAAVEKIIDSSWWDGTALNGFLTGQADSVLPWYQPVADLVVAPNVLLVSIVVVLAQLFAAATLLSGRRLRAGITVGAFLNLNFVAMGAVDPSVFYLICQAVLLLWILHGERKRPLRILATGSLALAVLNVPFVTTIDPHSVIEDPAIILVSLGLLVALASAAGVLQVGTPQQSRSSTRQIVRP